MTLWRCRSKAFNAAPLLALVWLCFLVKAIFYSSLMPVWEGDDEGSHFDFVDYLATVHRLPDVRSSTGSRALADSMRLAPVPWTLRDERPGEISHDRFWRLPASERIARDRAVRALRADRPRDPAYPGLPIYEAQQPPLAYLVFLPAYLAFRHTSLLTLAWALRIAGSLIASLVIPLGFLTGRRVFRNDWRAVGLTVVIAAMPELPILISHAGNEPLALVAGSALIYWLLRMAAGHDLVLSASMTGLILGCALLTKAYFVALILPVLAIGLILWMRRRDRQSALALLLPLTIALSMAGWWYARNWLMTGTLTGEMTDSAAQQAGMPVMQALFRANWLHAADFALTAHVWLGGWSFLTLRGWMYRAFAVLLVAASGGMVSLSIRKRTAPAVRGKRKGRRTRDQTTEGPARPAAIRRPGLARVPQKSKGRRTRRQRSEEPTRPAAIRRPGLARVPQKLLCAGIAASFWIGPAYHAIARYRISGTAETMGYYAYCVVVAEAVCLIAGIAALLPESAGRFVVPALTTGFAALEIYGALFLLLPYYGGFTAHTAAGSVPALHVAQLSDGGLERLFRNLALCEPWFLSAPALEALLVCYLLAVCAIVGIGFLVARCESREARLCDP